MTEHESIWRDLATMWEVHDPMPDGLVDTVLAAVATEDLDSEYEMLHLVERTRDLRGARSVAEDLIIEFTGGGFTMLLRITDSGEDHRRVDGWVAPAKPMTVSVRQGTTSWEAAVSRLGRFEFSHLPRGMSRFWLVAADAVTDTGDDDHLFATPTFEL